MTQVSINEYIGERYPRWLDYAQYQSTRAGIPEDAGDILNEVVLSLLQKDPGELNQMLSRKRKSYTYPDQLYTELDYYVLRMIQLNAVSQTSPWRFKTKKPPIDENADWTLLEVEDSESDESDPLPAQLDRWNRVREALESLPVPEQHKQIFAWKVFADNPLSSWPGPESYSETCRIFNSVKSQVIDAVRVNGKNAMTEQSSPEEERLQKLTVRLLKACIFQKREYENEFRIRKFANIFLSVKPVLQGVA